MKNAKDAHKKEEFLDIYDSHFTPFKYKPIRFLEIGVQHGGSLEIWRQYFENMTELVGVDCTKECKDFEEGITKIVIGDQADKELLESLGNFDIIVDDGGHSMHQQRVSFEVLFPKLNKGGIYVIEDLHTSYWGAFQDDTPTTEMLKEFIDDINGEATVSGRKIEDLPINPNKYEIKSMSIYESVVVIHKK
jgi:hypothetical protein